MKRLLTRTLAILAGIVLGMLVVAGSGPWQQLFRKSEQAPAAPIQRERAPDTRV